MIKLADIFIRDLWTADMIRLSSELVNFASGRHIVSNAQIASKVNNEDAGTTILIPYIDEGEYEEPSVMDDSDTKIASGKVKKGQDKAYVGFYAKAFGEKDIIKSVGSGIDPLEAAQSMIGRYWEKDLQKRQVATLKGLIAANIANNGSDLILTKDAVIEANDIIDTLTKIGDGTKNFTTMFCHSAVVGALMKVDSNNFTNVEPVSGGEQTITMYRGMTVIENDEFVGTVAGTYNTIFAKDGLFVYEMSSKIPMPIETDRDATDANGAGSTSVINRVGFLLHPQGNSFNDEDLTTVSPSLAYLQAPTTWTRTVGAKQSKFVVLVSKA